MVGDWFLNTINTGIWVFIGLSVWTVAFCVTRHLIKRNHRLNLPAKKNEISINHSIYNELVAIRVLTGGDRVYLSRFHNGSEFLPSHPVWKVSRTHEVVVPGITYESGRHQNLLVSLFPQIINPLITGSSDESGVTVCDCGGCSSKTECVKNNRYNLVIDVNDMAESLCKAFFNEQHIQQTFLSAIEKNGNVIGYLGIDFCTKTMSHEEMQETVRKVIANVTKIRFLLNQ